MRYYITLISILFCVLANAQETYSELRQKALETMHKAKDEDGYRLSLSLYENAFNKFPDSIDMRGLSKASVLASELKEFDKAFNFLNQLVETDENAEVFLPGWRSITGKYAESEYKNLLNDPRWKIVKEKALSKQKSFYKKLKDDENEFFNIQQSAFLSSNKKYMKKSNHIVLIYQRKNRIILFLSK